MSEVAASGFGPLAPQFKGVKAPNDLSAGVEAGFGHIGFKGKVWSIRYRGEETQLMRPDGDGAQGSIEVVILKAASNKSKIFYEQGYVEGANAAPDCYSTNGVTPVANAAKKQSNTCATCPKNVWGSRITPAGKQGKACQDSKRLAVVPLGDIKNEVYGGPLLLRVPAASLGDMAQYGDKMQQLGYPYYSVGTRISFDPKESYPKFLFRAIQPLTAAQADAVLAMQNTPQVTRILAEDEYETPTQNASSALAQAFEKPPTPQPTAGFGAEVTRQLPPQPAPVPPVAVGEPPTISFEDELDAKLASLLPN